MAPKSTQTVAVQSPSTTTPSVSGASSGTAAPLSDARRQLIAEAVAHFYSANETALNHFNVAPLGAVTTSDCLCLSRVKDQVSRLQKLHETFLGGGYSNLKVDGFIAIDASITSVSAFYGIEAGQVLNDAGTVVDRQPEFSQSQVALTLVLQKGIWKVSRVQVLTQGEPVK